MDVRALLVDLDGTLAETGAMNVRAYSMALAEVGVEVDPQLLSRRSNGRNWRQFLPPLVEAAGSAADPAVIAARKAKLYGAMIGSIRINVGLVSLLQSCRPAMRSALVTTASRANAHAVLAAHDLRRHFDEVVTGDDVERHKPDPEAYVLAARRLAVPAEHCLVFEDSAIGEQSARSAGMQVVRVAPLGPASPGSGAQ